MIDNMKYNIVNNNCITYVKTLFKGISLNNPVSQSANNQDNSSEDNTNKSDSSKKSVDSTVKPLDDTVNPAANPVNPLDNTVKPGDNPVKSGGEITQSGVNRKASLSTPAENSVETLPGLRRSAKFREAIFKSR